jgi:hypothetical protein
MLRSPFLAVILDDCTVPRDSNKTFPALGSTKKFCSIRFSTLPFFLSNYRSLSYVRFPIISSWSLRCLIRNQCNVNAEGRKVVSFIVFCALKDVSDA